MQQLFCINNRQRQYSHVCQLYPELLESLSWTHTEAFFVESAGIGTAGGNTEDVLSCPDQYTTQTAPLSMLTSYQHLWQQSTRMCQSQAPVGRGSS